MLGNMLCARVCLLPRYWSWFSAVYAADVISSLFTLCALWYRTEPVLFLIMPYFIQWSRL